MASNFESVEHASDLIHDFVCSPCKDDGLNNEAKFFCDECKKYYCNNCVLLHNKLFRTHSVLGRQDVSKWMGYAGLSPIEACDKHGDKKLELLCEDHDELCCHICVSLTHRMCHSIAHIPNLAATVKTTPEFKQFPTNVRLTTTKLQTLTDKRENNKKSIKENRNKILAEIKTLRKKVNDKFDEIEKKTNDILQDQLHEADDLLQEDIDKCTQLHDKIKYFLETIQSEQDNNSSYIAYKKCMDKMSEAESLLQDLSVKPDIILTFQADPRIEKFLSGLNTTGDIFYQNFVFKVKNKSRYKVTVKSDKTECIITGICELPGGETLITDFRNHKVKLLDSKYQVTATCNLPDAPRHICHIAANEAAVTLGDISVLFITVTGSTLSVTRKLTFSHGCLGISHYNGTLYIGSCTAIYQYTLSGQLVKKVYEDNSAFIAVNSFTVSRVTVDKFTVSRDGTNIYIPDPFHNKLITIDTSGNILSTLQDRDFDWPISVCASDRGHVFVCSHTSHTVTQVDKEGKHKLATLGTREDGLNFPNAVWFRRQTNSLIVGGDGNEISVFDLE